MLCHLHGEFNARVGAARDAPRLGVVIETIAEDLLKLQKILLDGQIVLPSQQQYRDTCIWGSVGLGIDEHGGVLQMAGERLEIGALGWRSSILYWRHRLVVVLSLCLWRKRDGEHLRTQFNGIEELTGSWFGCFSANLGARRRFLLEGSMVLLLSQGPRLDRCHSN